MRRTERLEKRSVSLLSATARIATFSDAVGEVVANALESGASRIDVTACPTALRFSVVDDGEGMSERGLSLLCESGATSKDVRCGFRGGSLFALACIASVEIRTRKEGSKLFRKWVRDGVTLFCGEEPDEVALPGRGTLVDVWEMFHATPVRKRDLLCSEFTAVNELESVRRLVSRYALFHPGITFSVSDGSRDILYEETRDKSEWLDRISSLLGHRAKSVLCALPKVQRNGFVLEGFATKEPVVNLGWGDGQFVALNNFIVEASPGAGSEIHKLMRSVWKQVSIQSGNRTDLSSRRSPAWVIAVCCHPRACSLERRGGEVSVTFKDRKSFEEAVDVMFTSFFGVTRPTRHTSPPKEVITTLPELGFWAVKRPRLPSPGESLPASLHEFDDRLLPVESSVKWTSRKATPSFPRPKIAPPTSISGRDLANRLQSAAPGWVNPCLPSDGKALAAVTKLTSAPGRNDYVEEFRYTAALVQSMRFIGNIGCKFVVVALPGSVHAIDQHAADERIRVERLQALLKGNGESFIVESQTCVAGTQMLLSSAERRILDTFRPCVQRYGWRLRWTGEGDTCDVFSVPCIDGTSVDDLNTLREYLHEIEEFGPDVATSGKSRALNDAIATIACRSAIMFGCTLPDREQRDLIQRLSRCHLPFQCAHGRPSVTPLAKWDLSIPNLNISPRENARKERLKQGLKLLRPTTEKLRRRRLLGKG